MTSLEQAESEPYAGPATLAPCVVSDRVEAAEWDAFVARHPLGTVDHLAGWARVFRDALGHQSVLLAARRGADIVGVLPIVLFRSRVFGRSVISLPFLNYGGLVTADAAADAALVADATARARAFAASHVELRHVERRLEPLPVRSHKVAMTRALPSSADELWQTLDRKIRNQVRKAQKEGLQIVSGGADLLGEFYRVFARNMRDLGTPVYPRRLFDATFASFPELARVFVVRRAGAAIAAGITLTWRGTSLNPWASSLREFRHLSPNVLLYWTMLEQAIGSGATVFDFGRSSPGGGTYQFKQQWGAQPTPLHWEYVLLSRAEPPNQGPAQPKFERAIRLWQRLPLGLANAIGPHVARHLP